jgi:hypothetical protein
LGDLSSRPRRDFGYAAKISSYYERGRFGLVVDARNQRTLSTEDRRRIARRMDADEARHPDRLACMGVVMSSSFQRGVFTTISWLTNAPFARQAFPSVELAKRWVVGHLKAAPPASAA